MESATTFNALNKFKPLALQLESLVEVGTFIGH